MRFGRRLILLALCAGFAVAGCERPKPPPSPEPPKAEAKVEGAAPDRLTLELLDTCIALCRTYLVTNQLEAGNFVYERDCVTGMTSFDDNSVRQIGALWGVALLHRDEPTPDTAKAFQRGIGFVKRNARKGPNGGTYVVYPGNDAGYSGGQALLCLALIDVLRADPEPENAEALRELLTSALRFLVSLRREDGHFAGGYRLDSGKPVAAPSPYSDGEALLAMVKAAKYCGHVGLRDTALASAEVMWRNNVEKALAVDPDSDTTKGFYQWGTMAFHELLTSGWEGTDVYAERILKLADWMIDVHDVLGRQRNTAYAFEGLACAYDTARRANDEAARAKIRSAIEKGLFKLTTWQVGSPVENAFIRTGGIHPAARGGIMNEANDAGLRIDVVQHQAHAMMLTRRYLYE